MRERQICSVRSRDRVRMDTKRQEVEVDGNDGDEGSLRNGESD